MTGDNALCAVQTQKYEAQIWIISTTEAKSHALVKQKDYHSQGGQNYNFSNWLHCIVDEEREDK